MEMFEASVDGELYDPERWVTSISHGLEVPEQWRKILHQEQHLLQHRKHLLLGYSTSTKAPAPTVSEDDVPFKSNEEVEAEAVSASTDAGGAGKDASDILAMIRARKTD